MTQSSASREFRGSTFRQQIELNAWTKKREEAVLEPDLPIIDPHHHLWDRRAIIAPSAEPPKHAFAQILHKVPLYLPDELTADLTIGHDVLTTVYMECGSMYRADGPEVLKPVGETEFVAAAAAKSIAHPGGKARICAGIVGHANLMLRRLTAAEFGGVAGIPGHAMSDAAKAPVARRDQRFEHRPRTVAERQIGMADDAGA